MPVAALVLPFEVRAEGPSGWVRLGAMDLVAEQLRQGGRLVLPSDNVVALTRDGGPYVRGGARTAELARAAGASVVVAGEAELAEGRWRVALRTLLGTDAPVVVEARASDVLEAARAAAASLENALGWADGIDAGTPAGSQLALRLRQVDAALLADQPEVARRLLEELDPDERGLPEARFRLAGLDLREGDLDAAQAAFEALLGSLPATDAPQLRARVLNALGNVQLRRDRPDRVAELSEQAIALLADLPPSPELGRALTGRAIARSLQGRYDESMEDFSRARIVLEGAGDRLGLARVEINVGILDARRARYAEALPVLAAAADRLTAYRDFNNELFARASLARVRLELLDVRAAVAGDERLRELVQAEPSPAKRRYANLVRAMVLQASGQLSSSATLLGDVRTDARATGDGVVEAMAAAVEARAALDAGDYARAVGAARASVSVDWSGESELDFARAWRTLLRAQREAGQGAEAAATLASMRDWASGRDDGGVQLQLDLAVAATGEGERSREAFERALARADARRVPAELVEVAGAYLPWLIAAGDGARASVLAGRIGGWAEADHAAALLQLRFQHAFGNADGWRNALVRARANAGERPLPDALVQAPARRG
jgi:tetratricopeptide (TPR) repeat protein